ncbi:hypothetical protein SAVCW2_54220 [Streptomyces avermitilis]|uniref:Uncharacterized protein n=1 Tax=Streptomyces avermitilis TaxID=33903 RepID=A0A499VVJ4_STRAX|nr:hypothetical protein SAVMC3_31660 [Streptomyces avermitilis]GDY86223.1 hypothetical protein SAVCW2_54220 [Streptomyces avermitilis]
MVCHRQLSRIRALDLRHLYEGAREMRENARVKADYKGDYQELVDEISALLGAPATLENRDFELIAFAAYDSDGDGGFDEATLDPVRTRSILTRRSTPAVRKWFEGFGIAQAAGPVRIPPTPEAGVHRGRVCLPVRHRGWCWAMCGCWTPIRGRPRSSWPPPWRSPPVSARSSATRRRRART